jgi:phosphate:Na+ symporter
MKFPALAKDNAVSRLLRFTTGKFAARVIVGTVLSTALVLAGGWLADEAPALAPGVAHAQTPDQNAAHFEASKDTEGSSLNVFGMTMAAVAGLVLFIFGLTQLADGLRDLNSERMRTLVARFTSNRFIGILTGTVATALLESSSVVIIMTIAMVSGGVLSFAHSLAVVLGANIGTTIGAQIIAFEFSQYVPVLMLGGLLLLFLGRSHLPRKLGMIVLGFGLLFYGLEAIDEAMKPLRNYEPALEWMKRLGDRPWLGAAVGAAFTVLVQSSSATIAIVITLAGSGLISLPAGVAIMLGAEVGTCADTLIATIGRGRPALRTGIFHLIFNLTTALLGIVFAPQLVQIAQAMSGGANVGRQIANAQIAFNLIGVTLVLGFLPAISRALERLIPDKRAAEPARIGDAAQAT